MRKQNMANPLDGPNTAKRRSSRFSYFRSLAPAIVVIGGAILIVCAPVPSKAQQKETSGQTETTAPPIKTPPTEKGTVKGGGTKGSLKKTGGTTSNPLLGPVKKGQKPSTKGGTKGGTKEGTKGGAKGGTKGGEGSQPQEQPPQEPTQPPPPPNQPQEGGTATSPSPQPTTPNPKTQEKPQTQPPKDEQKKETETPKPETPPPYTPPQPPTGKLHVVLMPGSCKPPGVVIWQDEKGVQYTAEYNADGDGRWLDPGPVGPPPPFPTGSEVPGQFVKCKPQ